MVQRIVIPLFASCFINLIIFKAVEESNPLVGSSNINKEGFVIISYPIEVLFLSPPDNPFMKYPPT